MNWPVRCVICREAAAFYCRYCGGHFCGPTGCVKAPVSEHTCEPVKEVARV